MEPYWLTLEQCSLPLADRDLCFFPLGARPELDTEIVIGEVVYDSYAIMYYQKRGQITMKLYSGFLSHVALVWYFRSYSQVGDRILFYSNSRHHGVVLVFCLQVGL